MNYSEMEKSMDNIIATPLKSLFVVYYNDSTENFGKIVSICEMRSTAERIKSSSSSPYDWKEVPVYRIGVDSYMKLDRFCITPPTNSDRESEEKRIQLETALAKKRAVLAKIRELGITEEEIAALG